MKSPSSELETRALGLVASRREVKWQKLEESIVETGLPLSGLSFSRQIERLGTMDVEPVLSVEASGRKLFKVLLGSVRTTFGLHFVVHCPGCGKSYRSQEGLLASARYAGENLGKVASLLEQPSSLGVENHKCIPTTYHVRSYTKNRVLAHAFEDDPDAEEDESCLVCGGPAEDHSE